ncbi:hypothetical protein OUZ56_032250 [Daphnia magna]|uniref:Uncharacterized protein n=1 Tax=Daphnia magna TaxID=35525 RepID=A0ABQ9ZWX3_9CRUS|nr:hypothetical protein OUZ56_032250 [Daphnia magna]
MKGMPEKYRIKCLAENQDRMDVDNGPRNGPPAGIQAHTVYFSAANNVDYSAANTVDCSAANTVDYSAANTTRIIQGNSLLIHLFTSSGGPNKCIIKHPMDVRFQIKWMFVFGCQLDVRFRTSNGSPVWTFYGEDIRTYYNH